MVKVGSPHQCAFFSLGLWQKGQVRAVQLPTCTGSRKAGVGRAHFSAKKLCSLILGLLCQLYACLEPPSLKLQHHVSLGQTAFFARPEGILPSLPPAWASLGHPGPIQMRRALLRLRVQIIQAGRRFLTLMSELFLGKGPGADTHQEAEGGESPSAGDSTPSPGADLLI